MANLNPKQKIILISLTSSLMMVFIGLLTGDVAVIGNLLILSVIISVVPYFLWKYSKLMWLKSIENQFPNLVRDLADSERSGMSLSEAIKIASKANYGKLSLEVQKMHNRLSWGTPFLRVLEIFGNGVKESKIILETLNIIRQSYEGGGDIAATLDSVARDMVMLKEAEAERSSLVKEQVMLMYGIFFMFLGVAIMIIFVMVPMIQTQPQGSTTSFSSGGANLGFSFSNPCKGITFFPCGFFSGICSMLGNIPDGIGCYYIAMFFSVVVIQGIFTGLIAGQLGENSAVAGVKHSLIMVFIAIGVFFFLAKAGMLPM
jgi:flagellar protein FlaJ